MRLPLGCAHRAMPRFSSPLTKALAVVVFVFLAATLGTYFPRPKGPNLGLPFGYYGKVNRIVAEVEANGLEILNVAMHRDWTIEDFWIRARTSDGSEIELDFRNANSRSFADLKASLAEQLRGWPDQLEGPSP